MTRIFIGYDEKFIFDALVMIYADVKNIHVIGGIENDRLLDNTPETNFDILLLELGRIKHKELNFVHNVKMKMPGVSLFLLTSKIPPQTVADLIKHQPVGFILKSCSKNDLVQATNMIVDGNKYFCHKITEMLYSDMIEEKNHENQNLTPREVEILTKLVNGDTNYTIAKSLNISETTAKTHRKNIMHKLGATSSFSLVRYACRENLIPRISDEYCKDCPCT